VNYPPCPDTGPHAGPKIGPKIDPKIDPEVSPKVGAKTHPGSKNGPRRVAYVLPVYNEADSLSAFHSALTSATATRSDLDFEFIYVDDGSKDNSIELLLDMRNHDPRVTVLSLSRNYGHQAAITAGMDLAAETNASAAIVMDTDLQDPPGVSLDMIAMWESGVDVVYAQRRSRQDGAFKA
jgi:polyisoprenyl-phosphate glycosyltransferase